MAATRGNPKLRLLDRYAGVPLVSLFALVPKRAMPPRGSIRRIGFLQTAAIGDTLLLSGPLRDVRGAYPDATLVLITGEDNREVAPLLPADEHVVLSARRPLAAVRAVRAARLDVLLDFGPWPRFDALVAAASGARFRAGFKTPGQARHFGYDHTVAHASDVHQLENQRRLLSVIGAPRGAGYAAPCIEAPRALPPDRMPARPFVVFHERSGGYRHEIKEWPADRWRDLADRYASHTIVRTRDVAYTLPEWADVFAAADAVVSVNTGLMHLAALVGARTLSLEGPTAASRWGPIGPRARAVTTTYDSCGYIDLGFEYDGQRLDCMEGISVDAVQRALDGLLTIP